MHKIVRGASSLSRFGMNMTYNKNNSINISRGRQVAVGAESLSHITIITDVSKFREKAREKGKAEHARHAP